MIRTLLLTLPLVAATALLPAQDDRDRTTKTAAIWQTNVTPAEMQTLINQGWRFTDLEIESTTNWEFTVSAVPNSGSYAKSWWWVYGVTTAQLSTTISQNNARIVDIESYDVNGGPIEAYTYTGSDVPRPGDERVHLNLWLFGGAAPTDGQPVDVVLSSFTFAP